LLNGNGHDAAIGKDTPQLLNAAVAVKKLDACKNGMILPDGKESVFPYESFIGHHDAALYWTSPQTEFLTATGLPRIRTFAIQKDGTLKNLGPANGFSSNSGFNGIAAN
jgi:hypothetical protein